LFQSGRLSRSFLLSGFCILHRVLGRNQHVEVLSAVPAMHDLLAVLTCLAGE
jgi:hypothetical protein